MKRCRSCKTLTNDKGEYSEKSDTVICNDCISRGEDEYIVCIKPHECKRDTESGFCGCDFYILDDPNYIIQDKDSTSDLILDIEY